MPVVLFVAALVMADTLCRKMPPRWVHTAAMTLLSQSRQPDPWVRWTLARLQDWVEREFGLTFSKETLRKVLRRMGFSWKKARKLLALANSAARQRFLQDLSGLLQRAHDGKLLLVFIDEAHIHLDADLGYGWGIQGHPWFIHSTSPGLHKVSFYGCYLYPLPQVRILPASKANASITIEILERLRHDYPELPLVILWDGASYHRAEAVYKRAQQLGIQLVPLPAYSPDLMPVEALWHWLRQALTAHHCHQSADELIDRVLDFEWLINQDPDILVARLDIRLHLDPDQEKLRISKVV
jgi:transposase